MDKRAYLAKQFAALEADIHHRQESFAKEIASEFDRAAKEAADKINLFYTGLSVVSYAAAHESLTSQELRNFQSLVRAYLREAKEKNLPESWQKQLEKLLVRLYLPKIQVLEAELRQAVELLYQRRLEGITELSTYAYEESYYRALYEVQKSTGSGTKFKILTAAGILAALSKPWADDEISFLERIPAYKSKLLLSLSRGIEQDISAGRPIKEVLANVQGKFNSQRASAQNEAMSEAPNFASEGRKEAYEELNIQRYIFIAILDERTSAICNSMHGRIFNVSEYEQGVTAPPLHNFCRSHDYPLLEDKRITKAAYQVPQSMSYESWRTQYAK